MLHTIHPTSQSYGTRVKTSHGQLTNGTTATFNATQHKVASPPTTSTASFSPTASMSFRYYQPPKQEALSESDEGSSDEGRTSYGSRRRENNAGSKRPGACIHCKTLKVKCHFTTGQSSCNRCQANRLNCVVSGRKKRRAVPTHEELIMKSRKQDQEISALLQRIDAMSTERNIAEWMSKSQPNSRNPSEASSSSKSSEMGVDASRLAQNLLSSMQRLENYPRCRFTREELYKYFPDESFDSSAQIPTIVSCGLVTPQDVYELFDIYFKYVNPYFSILDHVLHTPNRLFWKSHFLFTVICTVASRFYERQPNLQASLCDFARDCCGKALVGDEKTVDNCQAFLLMAVYQLPRRRYEHQRGWLYMGVAFRLALELKLNEPCDQSVNERNRLNRTRTWLNCYCVDASHATQFGKPAMIPVEDYTARQSRDWYRSSQHNLPIDIHLVAYVEVLQTMGRFKIEIDTKGTENDACTCLALSRRYNDYLLCLRDEWSRRFDKRPVSAEDRFICDYRADLHRMINAYSRLVVLAFGFQKAAAVKSGPPREEFCANVRLCIETAQEVIFRLTQRLAPTGFLRYGMEAHFLFVSFAAAFLINLLKPELAFLLNEEDRRAIPVRVRELVDVLRSNKVANEIGHAPNSPRLYARFLSAHLEQTVPKGLSAVTSSKSAREAISSHRPPDDAMQTWAHTDIRSTPYPNYNDSGFQGNNSFDSAYAQIAGSQFDFSLTNFVQTISAQPQLQHPSPPPGTSDYSSWTGTFLPNNQSLSNTFVWPMVMDAAPTNQYMHHSNEDYTT